MLKFATKVGNLGQIALIIAILSLTTTVSATQILVPADQPTIQAGINASSSGDTVFVSPGTYVENINFLGKNILLKSTEGREVTTILQATGDSAIVSFLHGESRSATLDGFRISNSTYNAAVRCISAGPTITHCLIDSSAANGIYFSDGAPAIIANEILDNGACGVGGFEVYSGQIEISENLIARSAYNGIALSSCSFGAVIQRNKIMNNRGGVSVQYAYGEVRIKNNIVANTAEGAAIEVDVGSDNEISSNTIDGSTDGIGYSSTSTYSWGSNNIIVNCSGNAVYDPNRTFSNTLFWNNAANFPAAYLLSAAAYVVADPQFTSPQTGDYSLLCSSPAIDLGNPLMLDPDGSRSDLGAIAFDHNANLPVARDFGIMDEDVFQVFSSSPVFTWSVDTASILTTIADTLSCDIDWFTGDTLGCDINYTYLVNSGKQLAYEFQLGTDDDWSMAELLSTGEVTGDDSTLVYSVPQLTQGTCYYARLRIKAANGWGCWRELVLRRNAAPTMPVHASPLHGSRLGLHDAHLELNKAADSEFDPIYCIFELYADESLSTFLYSDTTFQTAYPYISSDSLPALVAGAEYWWRARSADGNDASAWSTPTKFTAWATRSFRVPEDYPAIQTAINFAIDGDTIRLSPGTYEVERVSFLQKGLTLIGSAGADSTLIRSASSRECFVGFSSLASRSVISDVSFELLGRAFNPYNLTLKRCHFSQLSSAVQPIMMVDNLVSIDSCEFSYMRSAAIGGLPSQGAELSITNCIFHRDGTYSPSAIRLLGSASAPFHVTIANNHFAGQGNGQGIECGDATGHIENNELLNFASGMAISASSGLTIRNNILGGCTEYAMRAPFLATNYNCYWNNALNYSETTPGAHDLLADPLFIDAANGNYHLQCASPCIDAGDPASGGCIGKHRDIGVFEYDYQIGNANLKDSRSQVSISDIVYLLNYIFAGGEAPCPIGAGKVDCNEFISVSDCIYLLNYLFAHGPAPCTGCP